MQILVYDEFYAFLGIRTLYLALHLPGEVKNGRLLKDLTPTLIMLSLDSHSRHRFPHVDDQHATGKVLPTRVTGLL
jgi:hypothetical protein